MKELLKGQSEARSTRRPAGAMIVDGNQVADTEQCVHCGRHWMVQRGSGITRGFCLKCHGITCGTKKCDKCYSQKQWLDDKEKHGKQAIKVVTGYNSFNQVQFQFRVPLGAKEIEVPEKLNKDAVRVTYEVMTVNDANSRGIK